MIKYLYCPVVKTAIQHSAIIDFNKLMRSYFKRLASKIKTDFFVIFLNGKSKHTEIAFKSNCFQIPVRQ